MFQVKYRNSKGCCHLIKLADECTLYIHHSIHIYKLRLKSLWHSKHILVMPNFTSIQKCINYQRKTLVTKAQKCIFNCEFALVVFQTYQYVHKTLFPNLNSIL